jgi:DNA primase
MARREILYNHSAIYKDIQEPVMAVEGVFDALPYWPNAIAFLGKPGKSHVDMLKKSKRPVCIVMDGDAYRIGWSTANVLIFNGLRAGTVKLPPRSDPNDVDRNWLKQQVRKALQ